MAKKTLVIIGGVAAGTSAATKARRVSEELNIVLFEKQREIAYAGCGTPFLISGLVTDRDKLLVRKVQSFKERDNIDILTSHEVLTIDSSGKTVLVRDLQAGTNKEYYYDKLILATGSRPITLNVPGSTLPGIYTLKTLADAELLIARIASANPRRATIVGAGFIGLEMVEPFLALGMEVTVIEKTTHLLPALDPDIATIVDAHLRDKGVRVFASTSVDGFDGESGRGIKNINMANGAVIGSDLALLSIGVVPDVKLAREAGIIIGPTGAIVVDNYLRTNLLDVYAVGDAVETRNLVTGKTTWMPLGSIAQRQGRIAGENAAGGQAIFPGIVGTTIAKVCDLTVAKTGLNESEAVKRGLPLVSSVTHPFDHTQYYPGAHEMTLKLVADKETGRILGAQAIGRGGVDRTIDILAVAITKGTTVDELGCLDLAYCPPYSTPKDAVNIAGNVITNKYKGMAESISSAQLKSKLENNEDFILLDVRNSEEFQSGHLPKTKLIPLAELRSRLAELDKSKKIVTFCQHGVRAYLAYCILRNSGFTNIVYHDGGMASWTYQAEYPPDRRSARSSSCS